MHCNVQGVARAQTSVSASERRIVLVSVDI